MKIYHGTSFENGQSILKNGWNTNNQNWYVSNNDCVYFYYSSRDNEDFLGDKHLIFKALESAQITAALKHSQSTSLYVFSIEIDEEEIEDLKDYSCENMDSVALEIPIEVLLNKKIEYQLYENVFCPSLSLMYLNSIYLPYLNVSSLSSTEQHLINNWNMMDINGVSDFLLDNLYYAVCE